MLKKISLIIIIISSLGIVVSQFMFFHNVMYMAIGMGIGAAIGIALVHLKPAK